MGYRKTLEIVPMPLPSVLGIFDGELSSLLDALRIEDGEFIDNIIKRRLEIVDRLTNENAKNWWNHPATVPDDLV